ncbi:MAG: hypothetical protein ABIH24_09270 [Verrucomicrobiota bacterium]
MKHKFILFITLLALIITSSLAQETNKTGIVSVTKDYSGKVTAIMLIVNSYDIKLDENSKQLIYMDGERTLVAGMLNDEGGKKLIALDPPRQAQAQAGKTGVSSVAKDTGSQPAVVPIRETGTISITKDAVGQITAIKLIVDRCYIKLDENSKQLESMDGRKVRVTYDALFSEGLLPVTSVELIKESDSPVVPMPDK